MPQTGPSYARARAVATVVALAALVCLAGCSGHHCRCRSEAPPSVSDLASVVSADDRDAADRALDSGRKPLETLAFIGLRPGMRVGELGAGGGYTTELLARAVGPEGKVYAQNAPFVLARFAEKPWSDRLAKPVMANVVRLDREFADPFPPDVTDLDAVVNVLFYHDTYWQGVDRERMNRDVFAALRPGGVYVIVDHSARPEDGTTVTQTLHRVDESAVKGEIEGVGFQLVEEADFLRNPADPRDWNAAPGAAGERRGTSDRFVLKFVRP